MPYEPLKDEKEEEMHEGETSTKNHIHALNETFINFFKGLNGKELVQPKISSNSSVCLLCNMVGHSASGWSKCGRWNHWLKKRRRRRRRTLSQIWNW